MKQIRQTLKELDKVLLIVSIILFVFGLFNILTASSQVSVLRYSQSMYNYFYKQLFFLFVGGIGTLVILKFPTKSYYLLGKLAFFGVAALSIYVTLRGENYSGNQNWINFHGITIQPSEFAKPVLIVYLALLFEEFYQKCRKKNVDPKDKWNLIARILFVGCFFPLMIFTQKDYGTMMIIFALFGVMFLASPISRLDKLKSIGIGIVLGIICLGVYMINTSDNLLSDAQSSRFSFFDPCSNYESGGYQVCNGFIAMNSGGLLGVGIGNSRQKSYIPESHTDSVFAIISEEYGFLFTTVILCLYVVVLYRVLKLASLASTIRGKYICYGVSWYIFLHILINLGGLLGIMPLTGVPLPFLSYGGSYTLSLIIALALVQRVHYEYKNEKIKIA